MNQNNLITDRLDKQINLNFNVKNDWSKWGGFTGSISFTNQGKSLDGWTIEFDAPFDIYEIWRGEIVSRQGNRYVIKNVASNKDVDTGKTVDFVFNARVPDKKVTTPTNYIFNQRSFGGSVTTPEPPPLKTSIAFDFNVKNDWSKWGGFTGSISFTNQGKSLDGWTIEFDAPFDIYEIWRGEIVSRQGNRYVIKNVASNKDVDTGKTVDFVFNARVPDKKVTTPTNYIFNKQPIDGSIVNPKPSLPIPTPTPTPSPISSNAIAVGFEKHSNNTRYTGSEQRKDWDLLWSDDAKMSKYSMITDRVARSGNKSLQMIYPSNVEGGGGAAWKVPAQKEYYLSYWVHFDKDFAFDGRKHSGGKLPGLGGAGGLAAGGQTLNGNNGFTSRYMWRENGRAVLYLYHMNRPNQWGEDFQFKGNDGKNKYFERGKWHNLIQRVRINDGNQSNGEIDVWMDKEKVLSLDNLKFVTNNKGIDNVFFNTFHGGSSSDWWPERQVNAYFDDFIVSTNAADVGL